MNRIVATLVSLVWLLVAGCGPEAGKTGSASAENPGTPPSAEFIGLMSAGKNHLEQGDGTNALGVYRRALALAPTDLDLRLNMANAFLLMGDAAGAVRESMEALRLEPNSAAAHFLKGSAHLRLGEAQEAVKALENANRIEPGVTATLFQLGLARTGLKQWEGSIAAFREGIALDPNRLHSAAHYLMGQAYLRLGKLEEAQRELQQHQANVDGGGVGLGAATFERSKYTQARVPFKLDQPETQGITVAFVDATDRMLGAAASTYTGPVGVVDPRDSGDIGLLVLENSGGSRQFRFLAPAEGKLAPTSARFPAAPGDVYTRVLVADVQNDRYADAIVLGETGSRAFQFGTNGTVIDVTTQSRLGTLKALDGVLVDLDFTGRLDLVAVTAETRGVDVWRQALPFQFGLSSRTSGIPASLRDVTSVAPEDWNRDGNTDLLVSRRGSAPVLLEKQRGGPLVQRESPVWPEGSVICVADFNNDLRPDLALLRPGGIAVHFNGGGSTELTLPDGIPATGMRRLVAVDHDNDGWLDLWCIGRGVHAWRNRGMAGFTDVTRPLGLESLQGAEVAEVHFADFDQDCDPDLLVSLAGGGLKLFVNEGGDQNGMVKVHMVGNRSNASGIGCRVEIETGGLRLSRFVHRLPVEIGVGRHDRLDSFLVHWFNWPQGSAELPFNCREPLLALELTIQEGSCPYLYAWDGQRFRFVTDILGAAPLGLPVAEGRHIESDPEEYVWLGDDARFKPRDGMYEVRLTEELREVLYLDEAKLVVVDHATGTEVHATDKLLPRGPFPKGEIWTLENERPLIRAERLDGEDVTASLTRVDGKRVSPPKLRVPQLRGLAEPHGLILDFGALDASRPLVLVMNGWLRFGGGMANVAASLDPSLPFPFPVLEAEVAPGVWKHIDVTTGAPAGKTKTMLVDLEGKLQSGTRRLRWTSAFEIHWDRIALLEKAAPPVAALTRLRVVSPQVADLRFRGFGALLPLPQDAPQTPDYDLVEPNSVWTILPGGWCTRYGDVMGLVKERDEALVLLNSGDELSLRFPVPESLGQDPGLVRDFFLFVDGWDKDSDFHVTTGDRVEPLPYHGMDDQAYGRSARPPFPSDAWSAGYQTRWVEGAALKTRAALQAKTRPVSP